MIASHSGSEKGGEGGMRPGWHCRSGIWRGENIELWNLVAYVKLGLAFLQTVICYNP